MKKRVKLLTTIASLCLAVALMAFGVYAASSAKLTVGSQVTFSAQVSVTWGWKVETVNGATRETIAEGSKVIETSDPGAEGTGILAHDANIDEPTTGDKLPTTVEFVPVNASQIVYTFTCVNTGTGDNIHIKAAGDKLTDPDLTNCTVVYSAEWDSDQEAQANSANTVTYTITFTLTSAASSVVAPSFSHNFTTAE